MKLRSLVVSLSFAFCGMQLLGEPAPDKVVIGYVFCQNKALSPDEVRPEKLTHVNYAFANIRDGEMVEGYQNDAANFRTLTALKRKNPVLKILISVGGWTWSGGFSDMALTKESRKRFIDSATAFLRRHGLDGLDVDWEFPGQKGLNNTFRAEDRENSTALLAELRSALDRAGKEDGKRYLLTMATQAADEWLAHTEMNKAQLYLDFVNLMAYDQFEATSDALTGHHAPLFTNPANPKKTSAATMVEHYIAAGVPAKKIVLGVPFYGHAWAAVPPSDHGLYQPGTKPAQRVYTSFRDIRQNLENKNGYLRFWDDRASVPFLYNPEQRMFVSYEDEQSITAKARFVKERSLAGMMFWQYGEDADGALLGAIHSGLNSSRP